MPIIYSKVTTEPSVEPIILADAKIHLRVDHSDEDSLITILIQAARETVEKHTGRSLITQSRTIKLDNFPRTSILQLPYGPVSSVTSIQYSDEDDATQTMSASLYRVDTSSNIARIQVIDSWPGTYDKINAVTIVYVAGYGASGSSVPRPLVQAMYLILGHLYEHREHVGEEMFELPFGATVLMSPYVLEQSVIY